LAERKSKGNLCENSGFWRKEKANSEDKQIRKTMAEIQPGEPFHPMSGAMPKTQ
jgi:hypothetical protein